jgi:hypothetical protein
MIPMHHCQYRKGEWSFLFTCPARLFLKMDRVRQPEQYNMSETVPGRINSIVKIQNPSIEVHWVDRNLRMSMGWLFRRSMVCRSVRSAMSASAVPCG